jgi:hypothetical protein
MLEEPKGAYAATFDDVDGESEPAVEASTTET